MDLVIVFAICVVLGAAGYAIYRSKKAGQKCIGCPGCGTCTSCSGSCGK